MSNSQSTFVYRQATLGTSVSREARANRVNPEPRPSLIVHSILSSARARKGEQVASQAIRSVPPSHLSMARRVKREVSTRETRDKRRVTMYPESPATFLALLVPSPPSIVCFSLALEAESVVGVVIPSALRSSWLN